MLMLSDREEISRGLAEGLSYKQIASVVGRDRSVISREVRRHGGRHEYRAAAAQERALAARERPKQFAVDRHPRLRGIVHALLRRGWSPASIAGRLPTEHPDDEACRVSHEAIYQWIYATPVSTLARELLALRSGRTARRGGAKPPPAPRIKDPTYIDARPADAQGRAVPGHWEGDLVIGKNGKTAVATLVERTSRFLVLVPLTGRDALTVGRGVIAATSGLPAHMRASLAWDCGGRDGRPRHRHQGLDAGVLRPPTLAVGTRQQREPQPHRPRVLPERHGHHLGPEIPGDGGLRHQRPTP
ncbi:MULTISPECIES: IS30 family transposase [unclassified Pseudonocardia]|uniref:IS30 family transposase n=1 Tax=Pseudonocardia sp. Ae150A_Ps1 TaxID=1885028 RepID=UPI00201688DB|nr:MULTISPECIES: IS30 family transposase [unclassified Pseudonocardia]